MKHVQVTNAAKLVDITNKAKVALEIDKEVFRSIDLQKLKCYLSLTQINVGIKYSEYGLLMTRYNGEEKENPKEYLRIRPVDYD